VFEFGKPAVKLSDLDRICALPTVPSLTDEEVEELSDILLLDSARDEGFSFLPEQANMIAQYLNFDGLFGCAAAGAGKTLTALTIANLASRGEITKKHNKVLYLLPSNLVEQLKRAIKWSSKKIRFTAKFHFFSDYKGSDREVLSKTAGNGIYVLGFGLLSGKETEKLIHNVEPSLVIVDECHALTNNKSARTRRVMHYIKKNPTNMVLLSGTIVRRDIMEYYNLISYTLEENSPCPLPWPQADSLSLAMKEPAGFIPKAQVRMAKPLADWAGEEWQEAPIDNIDVIRKSYRKRLKTAPGVFISEDDKVACSLLLNPLRSEGHGTYGYEELKELVRKVEEEWVTPYGDEFDWSLEKFRWINELWQGFYHELLWPEDHPKVNQAKELHAQSNELAKELRTFLGEKHRPGMDTPLLVRNDMSKHRAVNVPESLFFAWEEWKRMQDPDLPTRISNPIRVSDFKVQAALKAWKKIDDGTGGIVWYHNRPFGRWLYEVFSEEYGPENVMLCTAGSKIKDQMVQTKGKILIASIEGHGTGTDGLQLNYHNNLVAQDLRTSKIAEQTIARTHRHGQKKDEIIFNILTASVYDDMQLSGILQNSYFVHLSHTKQRLLTGTWINSPVHFDTERLQLYGVDVVKGFTDKHLDELRELI